MYQLTGNLDDQDYDDDPDLPNVAALKREAVAIMDMVSSLNEERLHGKTFDRRQLRSVWAINQAAIRLAEETITTHARWEGIV